MSANPAKGGPGGKDAPPGELARGRPLSGPWSPLLLPTDAFPVEVPAPCSGFRWLLTPRLTMVEFVPISAPSSNICSIPAIVRTMVQGLQPRNKPPVRRHPRPHRSTSGDTRGDGTSAGHRLTNERKLLGFVWLTSSPDAVSLPLVSDVAPAKLPLFGPVGICFPPARR